MVQSVEVEVRTVEIGEDETIQIRMPSMKENNAADWEYSRAFNKAITQGITPRQVMLDKLRELEVWTTEDDEKRERLNEEIAAAMQDLEGAADKDDETAYEKFKSEVSELRAELIQHNSALNAYLNHCAEEKANEARMLYLTYACARSDSNRHLWKSYKDFQEDNNQVRINTIFMHFLLFINGMSTDISSSLPENQVILKSNRVVEEGGDAEDAEVDTKIDVKASEPEDADGSGS